MSRLHYLDATLSGSHRGRVVPGGGINCRTIELGEGEPCAAQIGAAQVSSAQVGAAQIGTPEIRPLQVRAGECGAVCPKTTQIEVRQRSVAGEGGVPRVGAPIQ